MADQATIMPGAYVAEGVILLADVIVGPSAVVLASQGSGDAQTKLGAGAVIGANATILPAVEIGERARISPGSVVTQSVPPLAIVEGNPARIVGYVDSTPSGRDGPSLLPVTLRLPTSHVRGVAVRELKTVVDIRGSLTVAEFERDLPFQPVRLFMVYDIPSTETRGAHAHRRCHQLLIAARGSLAVVADDGETRQEFLLDTPSIGLHLPNMTWGIQYKCSPNALLLVLASEPYDSDDYIRDYAEFVALTREARRT